ncbi:MAG: glycosyltransferase family 1 protein [Anaerolineaceae bacterium]|nr:glycosyltransferase family 1 protein [Anaerolineaceae bacterium]
MTAIRVLQMFTVLNRGGAETMIMNYYRNIDRAKVQFDFLVHRQERGAYEDEIEKLGGRIYRMLPVYPRYFTAYQKEIAQFLDKHKEYKILHGNFSELGYFIYREAFRQGVPTIICHAHNSKMSWDLKAPFRLYWKHACRDYITHMFSCSQAASAWFFGRENVQKAIIMNNAIETAKFSYDRQRSGALKVKFGWADKFVVGHVGRFNVQKNHRFLIDVFRSIRDRCSNAVLVLVGEGELEPEIAKKIQTLGLQDSVQFMGSRGDVNEILQAFDVFVFPSLFEGLPVTLVEAQAAGLKCLISDTIPAEGRITDLVEVIPLDQNAGYWAGQTLRYKDGYNRRNMYADIVASGYDIAANAKWLENFYLTESYNRHVRLQS